MPRYIDKDKVIEELKKRIEKYKILYNNNQSNLSKIALKEDIVEYNNLLSFIDTLEVKDGVDSSHPIKAMKEALRMEYEKGRADVLRCIDPDEMVADFYSQPLSKTRSLVSIYRQGIIDIVKRINNNEKTSINSTHSIDDGGVHRA